ncbi:hypothetical protein QYE76_059608 [Lolium multiflorum]|uniref:Retrotransposon protein, putative, Ty1-copia subclass n=1 Tax=Lolium multiflorum TaxID=4521 RepID=A0AAD8RZ05_LOLMU|nr:hypothetical protein QYE76_059608 [Lolium multiflorum]
MIPLSGRVAEAISWIPRDGIGGDGVSYGFPYRGSRYGGFRRRKGKSRGGTGGPDDRAAQPRGGPRRPRSGYVFILNGAASWASSKQCTVAKSSIESEYIAASEVSSEAVWMKRFIVELGVVPSALDPLVIYCDNMGAIANAQEPRSHKRLKHIKLRYHSIREYIEDGEVKICKVHTDLNVADPLTKALPREKHDQHQNAMGVRHFLLVTTFKKVVAFDAFEELVPPSTSSVFIVVGACRLRFRLRPGPCLLLFRRSLLSLLLRLQPSPPGIFILILFLLLLMAVVGDILHLLHLAIRRRGARAARRGSSFPPMAPSQWLLLAIGVRWQREVAHGQRGEVAQS